MIPKQIYYTYKSYEDIPKHIRARIEEYKTKNPDFEFIFYSDEDIHSFVAQYYPNLLRYYEAIDDTYGAAKADFFRYLVTYHFGGYYMDHKIHINGYLKDIKVDNSSFVVSLHAAYADIWNELAYYTYRDDPFGDHRLIIQFFFASEAKHPLLWKIIETMIERIKFVSSTKKKYPDRINIYTGSYNSGAFGTHWVTGPILFNDVILEHHQQYPNVKFLQNSFDNIVFYELKYISYTIDKLLKANKTYHVNGKKLIKHDVSGDEIKPSPQLHKVNYFTYSSKKLALLIKTLVKYINRYRKSNSGNNPLMEEGIVGIR